MLIVNKNNYQEEVLNKNFVLVDFFADWCGPCRMISPFLEEIMEEMKIDIVKINIDESPELASDNEVMSIPTLMIFKKGVKISTNIGASSKARLIDWINANSQK